MLHVLLVVFYCACGTLQACSGRRFAPLQSYEESTPFTPALHTDEANADLTNVDEAPNTLQAITPPPGADHLLHVHLLHDHATELTQTPHLPSLATATATAAQDSASSPHHPSNYTAHNGMQAVQFSRRRLSNLQPQPPPSTPPIAPPPLTTTSANTTTTTSPNVTLTAPPPPPTPGTANTVGPVAAASVIATLLLVIAFAAFIFIRRKLQNASEEVPRSEEPILPHRSATIHHSKSHYTSRTPSHTRSISASRASSPSRPTRTPSRTKSRSDRSHPSSAADYNESQYAAAPSASVAAATEAIGAAASSASFLTSAAAQHARHASRDSEASTRVTAKRNILHAQHASRDNEAIARVNANANIQHASSQSNKNVQQSGIGNGKVELSNGKGINWAALPRPRGNPAGASLTITSSTYMGCSSLNSLGTTDMNLKPWVPRQEPPTPPSDMSVKACMKYMHEQLDCFGGENPLLGMFVMLGTEERRQGGTALVQFARGTKGTGLEVYAIKFFVRRGSYDEEACMYQSFPPELRRFMPTVVKYAPNTNRKIKDPFGRPLPPFIVMEKGESLRDRAKNCPVDVFTAAQVLGHISQRISQLHSVGYAHRDLKPANIMWLPSSYTWVLIDFGLTAKIGEKSKLGCTPTYAAPETVCAVKNAQSSVVVDPAVDAWALGVIAFELLVGKPAFGMFANKAQVYAELSDPKNLLPWEEGRITRKEINKLGMFRKAVLQLLHRDPCKRCNARQFSSAIATIYQRHTETHTLTRTAGDHSLQDSEQDSELQPANRYFI